MKKIAHILILIIFAISSNPGFVYADDLHVYDPARQYSTPAQTTEELQEGFLKATRLLQKKQMLEILSEQSPDLRRAGSAIAFQPAGLNSFTPVLPAGITTPPSASAVYQWLATNQSQSLLGLVESYPQDGQNNQGFTYDEAVAGIAFVAQRDLIAAKKIFDFYNSQWDNSGFWTNYNTQDVFGQKLETAKIVGPNTWIGIFALSYYSETRDVQALDLAVKVGRWISGLPHNGGGVAMSFDDPLGIPNWGAIYSVENNISYYGFLKLLASKAPLQTDRTLFAAELTGVKQWLANTAYNRDLGLFKRGPSNSVNDMTLSFDTNSWAVSALGVEGVKELLNFDDSQMSLYIGRIEHYFGVQRDGTFGGNMLTAKGFDFSGSDNASRCGRTGIKWVEGTNQMIVVYQMLSEYFRKAGNNIEADKYSARADHFASLNAENLTADGKSYTYSDLANARVFWDVGVWRTSPGPAVASSSWVYFSLNGLNPFNPHGQRSLTSALSFTASTTSFLMNDLSLEIGLDLAASVHMNGRTFQGLLDLDTLKISLEGVHDPFSTAAQEDWVLGLSESYLSGVSVYSLSSFSKLQHYADSSFYNYSYNFYFDGSLSSDLFYYSRGVNDQLLSRDFTYTRAGQQTLVDTVVGVSYSNDVYSYGSMMDYEYDAIGHISSITVTMETRSNPLFRMLMTHQYLFGAHGIEILYLGNQLVPVN